MKVLWRRKLLGKVALNRPFQHRMAYSAWPKLSVWWLLMLESFGRKEINLGITPVKGCGWFHSLLTCKARNTREYFQHVALWFTFAYLLRSQNCSTLSFVTAGFCAWFIANNEILLKEILPIHRAFYSSRINQINGNWALIGSASCWPPLAQIANAPLFHNLLFITHKLTRF